MNRFNVNISDNFLILFALSAVTILAFKGAIDPANIATALITFATTAYRSRQNDKPPDSDNY